MQIRGSESTVLAWHRAAPVDDRMAVMPMDLLAYSSIGSSHINQVLRNVLGTATVAECPVATDSQQRLSLHLVEARDSALAEACKSGLLWDVLAYAMETEELDVVTLHPVST